jgi:hypothetical protein
MEQAYPMAAFAMVSPGHPLLKAITPQTGMGLSPSRQR